MDYTQEEILKKYQSLPEDIQEAIFSMDTANIIQKIAKENSLNVEKMGTLADETGLLMLGITKPSEFISNLASRLSINNETAKKVGQAINTQIFAKIRESLKKLHEEPVQKEKPAQSPKNIETSKEDEPTFKFPQIIKPHPSFGAEKNIVQEKTKDQIIRSKPQTTEKPAESPKPKPQPKPRYPGGIDPYREPTG